MGKLSCGGPLVTMDINCWTKSETLRRDINYYMNDMVRTCLADLSSLVLVEKPDEQ